MQFPLEKIEWKFECNEECVDAQEVTIVADRLANDSIGTARLDKSRPS